jgi:hypothetical protein
MRSSGSASPSGRRHRSKTPAGRRRQLRRHHRAHPRRAVELVATPERPLGGVLTTPPPQSGLAVGQHGSDLGPGCRHQAHRRLGSAPGDRPVAVERPVAVVAVAVARVEAQRDDVGARVSDRPPPVRRRIEAREDRPRRAPRHAVRRARQDGPGAIVVGDPVMAVGVMRMEAAAREEGIRRGRGPDERHGSSEEAAPGETRRSKRELSRVWLVP